MATTLQTYLTQVQRLLHDPNANFWPIAELTDYINDGRNRVASDSKALRQVVPGIVLTAQTDTYNVSSTVAAVLAGFTPIDVMGISLYYGNSRYRLNYEPFTRLDAKYRSYSTNYQRPAAYSRLGALSIVFGPNPDQAYVTDWDIACNPPAMVLPTDVEVLTPPFTTPVKYYAAYLAKFKEQQMGESKMFMDTYRQSVMHSCKSFMTRIIPDPYAT